MTDENALQEITESTETENAPESWSKNIKYASFYARLAAFLIDFIVILMPLSVALTFVTTQVMGSPTLSQEELALLVEAQGKGAANMTALSHRLNRLLVEYALYGGLAGIVWVGCWHYFSATPGKLLFRIRIVDEETGMPPSLKRYILRYFGLILSGAVIGIGFFWVQWNKRRRAWHDMMTGTIVVKKDSLPEPQASATLAKAQES